MLKWKIETAEGRIKHERERIKQILVDMKHRHDKFIPKWIPEWLATTDEEHFELKEEFAKCDGCGKTVERWVETDFSFCDEYDCGMKLCKDCAEKIHEISKEL